MKRLMETAALGAALALACSDEPGPGILTVNPSLEGGGGSSMPDGTASNDASEADGSGRGESDAPSDGGDGASQDDGGDEASQDDGLVRFDRDVHPILVEACGLSGCHNAPSQLPGHGSPDVDEAFAEVQRESRDAPVYERILARAAGDDPAGFMPPPYAGCEEALGAPGCLTEAEFEIIQAWVDQGAMTR